MHYTYVLRSLKDRKLYIGTTKDLQRRYKEHQQGRNVPTQHRRPFEMIFYEAFKDSEDAIRREHYFKTDKGKSTLRQMLRKSLG